MPTWLRLPHKNPLIPFTKSSPTCNAVSGPVQSPDSTTKHPSLTATSKSLHFDELASTHMLDLCTTYTLTPAGHTVHSAANRNKVRFIDLDLWSRIDGWGRGYSPRFDELASTHIDSRTAYPLTHSRRLGGHVIHFSGQQNARRDLQRLDELASTYSDRSFHRLPIYVWRAHNSIQWPTNARRAHRSWMEGAGGQISLPHSGEVDYQISSCWVEHFLGNSPNTGRKQILKGICCHLLPGKFTRLSHTLR